MLFVRDFPDEATLLDISRRFSGMDPRAVRACLSLGLTTRDLRLEFERFLGGYGLSPGRFLTLMYMYRDPRTPVSPSALALGVGVTRATMTGLLDGLEREGLVERQEESGDRRRKSVSLTPAGLDLMDRVAPDYCERTTRFARQLSAEDWATLGALLARLQDSVGTFAEDEMESIAKD